MKNRVVRGIVTALCLAMMVPSAACVMPGAAIVAEAAADLATEQTEAKNKLDDWKMNNITSGHAKEAQIDAIISDAKTKIDGMKSISGVTTCYDNTLGKLNEILHPSVKNDKDDDEEEESVPVNADHFLMVGGSWVTPVASAGKGVSIVLPVVNMGKTMVTDAVVTPVLSTDSKVWPFEITNSNYSQTIKDLPGTDTGASDMDRRREVTWNLQTRSDIGSGYQKLSFDVRYRDSEGKSQSTTLDTYIQLSGTAGVGSDGQASVPRVIVTGFETNPETVHAGESFMLTIHLKNTSTATSVSNMLFEVVAAAEGKDADTTYAAFLPTEGSSTIFVDRIAKNGTKDIQIELEAKADLVQKPYVVDVNMSYEDEHVNSYTNKTSVSIPVKQEARVDFSEPEVMPGNIEVGGESNIMFSIYNMGKTKLYNVQVKLDSETISGGDTFIGNIESGATGSVDIYAIGQAATMDDGTVKILVTYEDETGEATTVEKTISLYVSEPYMDDMMMDDMIMDDMMVEEEGLSKVTQYLIAIVGVIGIAAVIAVLTIRRKKKKAQQSLEEELLDLDNDDELN